MGGRGTSSQRPGGGGASARDIVTYTSLQVGDGLMENKKREANRVLKTMRDIEQKYGDIAKDIGVAEVKGKLTDALAYWSSNGSIGINERYYSNKEMTKAVDDSIKSGFHPPRGRKSAMESVVAHEMGHALAKHLINKVGFNESHIMAEARKRLGTRKNYDISSKISGYAVEGGNVETVAEAFSDVWCNGNKAKRESRVIVDIMNEQYEESKKRS